MQTEQPSSKGMKKKQKNTEPGENPAWVETQWAYQTVAPIKQPNQVCWRKGHMLHEFPQRKYIAFFIA